jgi:hypothetical protein
VKVECRDAQKRKHIADRCRPLKFKLALREHWDAPTCPALKALQGLGDTLGVIVKCQPEWPIIVNDLRPVYDERGVDLVASVAGLVRSVCEAVCELVDDNGDETWGDTLLEKLGESFRTLKIFPEVRQAVNLSP